MEFLVAGVFQSQGFLVRRDVPLTYGSSALDATDIDVLGIRFTEPFQLHRMVCDCKDRQRSRPYERIFWAKGLGAFVNASEVYVCVPKASLDIVSFARAGAVRVLTAEVLHQTGTRLTPYGSAHESLISPLREAVARIGKKQRLVQTLDSQAKALYLMEDPYVGLNVVLQNLRAAAVNVREHNSTDETMCWRYITAEYLVLIPVFLLQLAADTIALTKEQRAAHIVDRLTYGDVSKQKAEEIFKIAKEYAYETARALTPTAGSSAYLPFDLGRIESPPYAASVSGLVERALLNPRLYTDLPQVLDCLLFEQALQNTPFDEQQVRTFFGSQLLEERLKVARNIFVFARDACGLDLKVFWPKQEGTLPRTANNVPDRAANS